jgi:SP family sugar:H+ symporter-like MFS transporter
MIYETKGLTLEEVDELYSEVKVARRSVGWKPTVTFTQIRDKAAAFGESVPTEEQVEGREKGQ